MAEMSLALTLLFLYLSMAPGCRGLGQLSPENRLFRDVMQNYNRNIRPRMNPHEKMTINVSFSLKKIESLDEKNQVMTSFGWIVMVWKDELLSWDPAQYNGTYRLTVSNDELWIPELAMFNSVDTGDDLSMESKFRIVVYADGTVFWGPGFKWRTSCSVNLLYFPYDEQICRVQFVNWMYGMQYLTYAVGEASLEAAESNDVWDLVNVTAKDLILFEEDGFGVPSMYFEVTLRRKPAYYIMNVVVPCIIIAVLSLLVFLLPSEAGEKMSLAITVFLAYTVLLLMLSDITPKSGETMPLISLLIVENMAQTALSLFFTVFILRIFHASPRTPVPGCLRSLVLGCMARILCVRNESKDGLLSSQKVSPNDRSMATKHNAPMIISILSQQDLRDVKFDQAGMDTVSRNISMSDDVNGYLRLLATREAEKETMERNKEEWEMMSRVLDRFFFFLFLTILAIETTAFLVAIRHI